jgi:hypothetical protein
VIAVEAIACLWLVIQAASASSKRLGSVRVRDDDRRVLRIKPQS